MVANYLNPLGIWAVFEVMKVLVGHGLRSADLNRVCRDKGFALQLAKFWQSGGWPEPKAVVVDEVRVKMPADSRSLNFWDLVKALKRLGLLGLTGIQFTKILSDKGFTAQLVKFWRSGGWPEPKPFAFPRVVDIAALKEEWSLFWQNRTVFNDFADISIPPHEPGFDRLLIIPKGSTPEGLFLLCQRSFACVRQPQDDLNFTSDRDASEAGYAVWVRDQREPDLQHRKRSADKIREMCIVPITYEERLVLELKFFSERRCHLDISGTTLCAGSRNQENVIPLVGVEGGKFAVRLDYSRQRRGDKGIREVVALAKWSFNNDLLVRRVLIQNRARLFLFKKLPYGAVWQFFRVVVYALTHGLSKI